MKPIPEWPKVSVISVNYNQKEVTAAMLRSLSAVRYPDLEIILVDNGSAEDAGSLQKEFPGIIYLPSPENLGFAGGNNLGINRATGEILVLLNNDTEVDPDFLTPLVATFRSHPEAGIVSPLILFHHTENTIQYAGTGAIDPRTCRGFTRGYLETDRGQYREVVKTSLCHGACMAIHRRVFDTIGLLPELYFLYYEEYDFCMQARSAGFDIYFNGHSRVYHKESVSTGRFSPLKAYYMTRNRVLFAKRNFHGVNRWLSLAFFYGLALPKNLVSELLKGRTANCSAMLKGSFSSLFKRV